MAISKLTNDLNIIAKLDDEPNDAGGLSPTELKAEFDKAGNQIKDYINTTMLPELETAIELAAEGVSAGGTIGTEGIADSAITSAKIADSSVTQGKIANASIITGKLAAGAVTAEKIAAGAVSTEAIASKAVNTQKLGDGAVTSAKIDDAAVITDKIADLAVTNAKLSGNIEATKLAGSIPMSKLDSGTVQSKFIQISGTALSGSTSGRINNANIHSGSALVVAPAPSSFANWRNYGVRASSQGEGYVAFSSDVATTVTANVLIFN